MKVIQWYPGHMAKAMRMMAENLKFCDAVVFVLDARAPASTYNRRLTELAGDKPVLYVLNKSDLADGKSDELLAAIRASGKNAIKIDANTPAGARA
ncbi:MAG: ribosome biogenesis GTPase YlqF, partial [Clostridiales bacterium]|nr:ribosome biogenesis GTPase YlqF [Clostridiales bacterium]